jgi:hypothetical protein
LDWSDDFDVADWIHERLHPFARDVGSVIPDAFDAYVVLVHPDRDDEPPAKVLEHLGAALAGHTSTPDRIWYCIWEGYAPVHGGRALPGEPPGLVPPAVRAGGRVRLPNRDYYLYAGDRGGWSSLSPWTLPNIWWPEDHSWCVAREIDFVATYIGGTQSLIAALRADPTLPVISVSATEPFQEGREFDAYGD